jgi:1-acyl-sn-glycerol-3-phosphate acyltransferase
MFGVVRSAAILLLTFAASAAAYLAGTRGPGEPGASRVMGWWGRTFIRFGGWKLDVAGMENLPSGGAVLVSNHQSLVDIPLLLTAFARPVRFVAKRELGRIPLFGKAMARAGNLFVDRDDPRDAVRMLRDATDRLAQGQLLVVFPEGTRSDDGSIGEFKPGAFYLAQKSRAPVVPLYIDGGVIALPKGALRLRAARLGVQVLPPLAADEGVGDPKQRIALAARERILAARNARNAVAAH